MSHVHAMCLELASSKKFSAHAQICQHAWMEKHHNYINYLFANKARKKQKQQQNKNTQKQQNKNTQFCNSDTSVMETHCVEPIIMLIIIRSDDSDPEN